MTRTLTFYYVITQNYVYEKLHGFRLYTNKFAHSILIIVHNEHTTTLQVIAAAFIFQF